MSTLLLGYPGPVAVEVAALLSRRGLPLLVVGTGPAGSQPPPGHEFVGGNAASIDFGLGREVHARLLDQVEEIIVAQTLDQEVSPVADLESASVVRVACEVREFVSQQLRPAQVRFLSSLRIFGDWRGAGAEGDFHLSQGFDDRGSEALAVAERQMRLLSSEQLMAIVRIAPLVGGRNDGLWSHTDLARILSRAQLCPDEVELELSDRAFLFETVERAAEALVAAPCGASHRCYHVVDDEPWTERRLVEWACGRFDKRARALHVGSSRLHRALGSARGRAWHVPTWTTQFSRSHAEEAFGELLQRDVRSTLDALADVRMKRAVPS